jgi:hypothetical protein
MTRQQFKKLKVGDRVCLPHGRRRLRATSTQGLEIDKYFGNLKVLLGHGWISYRHIQKGRRSGQKGGVVGMVSGLTYRAHGIDTEFKNS